MVAAANRAKLDGRNASGKKCDCVRCSVPADGKCLATNRASRGLAERNNKSVAARNPCWRPLKRPYDPNPLQRVNRCGDLTRILAWQITNIDCQVA